MTGIIAGNAVVGTTDGDGYLLGQGVAPGAYVYVTKIFRNDLERNFAHRLFIGV